MTNRPILSAEEEREVAASERILAAVHTYLVEMEETEEGGEEIEIRQFEAMKATIAVADRARDQRAEREDAQRPRPEAASPVTEGEAPASTVQPPSSQDSGVGETEGWQPIKTAPTDTPYTSDLPDEADGDAIGWAISDDDGRMLFLVWWEEQSPGRWTVTKWHPLPSAPRPSQEN